LATQSAAIPFPFAIPAYTTAECEIRNTIPKLAEKQGILTNITRLY